MTPVSIGGERNMKITNPAGLERAFISERLTTAQHAVHRKKRLAAISTRLSS